MIKLNQLNCIGVEAIIIDKFLFNIILIIGRLYNDPGDQYINGPGLRASG